MLLAYWVGMAAKSPLNRLLPEVPPAHFEGQFWTLHRPNDEGAWAWMPSIELSSKAQGAANTRVDPLFVQISARPRLNTLKQRTPALKHGIPSESGVRLLGS